MNGYPSGCGGLGEGIPQGLKPAVFRFGERAKPEGLAYLDASATACAYGMTMQKDRQWQGREG